MAATPPTDARTSSPWSLVVPAILQDRRKFILVVALAVLSTGATLVEPIVYRMAVNDVSGLFVDQAVRATKNRYDIDQDRAIPVHKEAHHRGHVARRTPEQVWPTLLWAVIILFAVNIVGKILWWVGDNQNVRLTCIVERRYLENAFGHVLRLPLRFFGERSSSAIVKRIDQTEQLTEIMNGFSQQVLPEVISLVGILAIMLSQNVVLTLLSLSVVPFYLWLAWRSSKHLETGLDAYYEHWEAVSARMQDAVSGIKTVKLSGAEQREVNALRVSSDKAYGNYIQRSLLVNKYTFWETALTYVVSALVLAYGGWLALDHKLTPGDVVMFVAFIDRLYDPIDSLSSLWVDMQQAAASLARSQRLLGNVMEEPVGQPIEVVQGSVEFRDVHFGYKPEREVLKGLSFRVAPGTKVALVGGSGAGKTTTVDLLLKLFAPWSGDILVDGRSILNSDPAAVRRSIGMVMSDGMVFRGSLMDNIRYGRPDAAETEVLDAAIAAGMAHTLERLPNGLRTEVGEGGMGLSVGERQRVQIARVLLARPKILVLDEATANLDFATELEVKKTIDEVRKENTVIVIAHRYSMVQDCDLVIVLDDGRISEQGPPAELIAAGKWFAEFARAQDEEPAEEEDDDAEESEDDADEGEDGDVEAQ
ncbi:MAG TPA: ABC transporter ATP-binding protein [Flavobacteriales bacterium]|nr:ABC transporter ATP-binding protein [Flavobacteriales bacterium]